MLHFAKELFEELLAKLEGHENTGDAHSFLPGYYLGLIQSSIDRLKAKLKLHVFPGEEEECAFYKSGLPLILYLFVYYAEKFELETLQLAGTPEGNAEYFERQLHTIHDYFKTHAEFFKYYRSDRADLDKNYFLPSSIANRESPDLLCNLIDPSFGTLYSVRIACFLAYARLAKDIRYLSDGKTKEISAPKTGKSRLKWTDPIASAVEMIYGYKAQGTFNDGKATIKEIIECFESAFDIRIPNGSRTFQELLSRKKGYTTYIDEMGENLKSFIDDIEDNHIR